jgi:hypothetical protein
MATLEQVADFRSAIDDLSTLAISDVNELLTALDGAPPVEVRNALIQLLPEVVGPYVLASSEVAATWYEDLRSAAINGTYYATADGAVNLAQTEALARYGVKPLFGQSQSSVLSLVGGGLQKMVAGASRDTIDANINRDPVLVGYARIPQAGCCSFCGMIASRGAVFRSAASAGTVVGQGVDSSIALDQDGNRRKGYIGGVGGGVKARGVQKLGKKFHNFCRCVATPVFRDADNSAVTETAAKYDAMYRDLESADGSKRKPGQAVTVKDVLADWRFTHGTK